MNYGQEVNSIEELRGLLNPSLLSGFKKGIHTNVKPKRGLVVDRKLFSIPKKVDKKLANETSDVVDLLPTKKKRNRSIPIIGGIQKRNRLYNKPRVNKFEIDETCLPNQCRKIFASGWRVIGEKRIYARSKWEANYARYLQMLLDNGKILAWDHEPDTFWFLKIKRGVRSYLPDFKVTELNGEIIYHEVKGFMDSKSITKFNRMRIYYPLVKIVLIREDWFKAQGTILCGICNGWE